MSPNEACYIDIDPIEPNTLVPFNDSIAKGKAREYKEKSKVVNGNVFEVWDSNIHQKLRFYTSNTDTSTTKSSMQQIEQSESQWKRITDLSMNPGIVKEKL